MKYLLVLFFIWPICVFSQNTQMNGDINVDGDVNVADIVTLVNIIMNKGLDNGSDALNQSNEIEIKKVYGDGSTYCAFTSLVKRDGFYYIAFRESMMHVGPGDYGAIKIIRSDDLENWNVVANIKAKEIDLRDPCLCIMKDGRILLTCGARMLVDNRYVTRTYYSKENSDGSFPNVKKCLLPELTGAKLCEWLWRLTWKDDIGYGFCYKQDEVGGKFALSLLKTEDGESFQHVAEMNLLGMPSEAKIQILEDKSMLAIVRNDDSSAPFGYIGRSFPPYTQWDWKQLDIYIAGEDFIVDGEKIILCTRTRYNVADRTCIFIGDLNGNFRWNYILPSRKEGGDTSYGGIVDAGEEYIISYYTKIYSLMPSIYLARMPKTVLPK